MHTRDEILDIIREKAKKYGAKKIILFGSFLETPGIAQDIDLACGIDGLNLFAFAGELENQLRIPIDAFPLNVDNQFIEAIIARGKVIYG